jgi:DNA-binding transcriptional LysR family regulator
MPELGALEVLLAVSSTGSLNAAARELGVTQQAISARVASLESRAGVGLLTRSAHGSTLTAAGIVVAEWADRLLRVAADVDAGIAALREDRRARVRVSASLTVAEQLLPGWLVSFHDAAARSGAKPVRVVLTGATSDQVADQVRAGKADLGFVEGPRLPGGVRSRVVAVDELCLVVAPDHPWARRTRPVSAPELLRTALVAREPGSGTGDSLTAALRTTLGAAAVQAPPVLELSTAAAVRAAVLAGVGPAVMSRLAVADDLASRRLREVKVADLELHRQLRAIWLGSRLPAAVAVRDLLTHITARTA